MKPKFIDRSAHRDTSFQCSLYRDNNFLRVWHYHPEYELVLILKSEGTRFIGDHIESFTPGEVILVGKNLPHMWQNTDDYYNTKSNLSAEAIAIHFNENSFGNDFFKLPEMRKVSHLLQRASRGVQFLGEIKNKVATLIEEMLNQSELNKLIHFLKILELLSDIKEKDMRLLSSASFTSTTLHKDQREGQVFSFILNNFKNKVCLEEVADIAHMSPSAFSRYFKQINGKNFVQFLNEIRVGQACKMLAENSISVTEACYNSGFNNLSNFNKQFKSITKLSPKEYKMKYG